jgi:hypothetical protein
MTLPSRYPEVTVSGSPRQMGEKIAGGVAEKYPG